MSILPAPFINIRRFVCATILLSMSSLFYVTTAQAAVDPSSIRFPLYPDGFTQQELDASGCNVNDLNNMSIQAFKDVNSASKGYAQVYGVVSANNSVSDKCQMTMGPLIQQAQHEAQQGLMSYFQNAAVGKFIAGLVNSQIAEQAIGNLRASCDDTFKENTKYVNDMRDNGLFALNSTGTYNTRAKAEQSASGTNEAVALNADGSANTASGYKNYDRDAMDLAEKYASPAVTGTTKAPGVYSYCDNTYAITGYETGEENQTADANIYQVSACSWKTPATKDGTGYWHFYMCLTANDGTQKATELHTNSPSDPPVPRIQPLTNEACPLPPRDSYNNANAFRLNRSAPATTSSSKSAPVAPAPKQTPVAPKTTTPPSKSGITY